VKTVEIDLAADEFSVSFDSEEVGTEQMFEAIEQIGYSPSLTRSRVALNSEQEISESLPQLLRTAQDQAVAAGKRVFIDFYAKWCGACRAMDKTTFADAAVQEALAAGYIFVKVDTDDHPAISKRFNVLGLPTLMILDEMGDVVFRYTGPLQAGALLQRLQEADKKE